MKIKFYILTVFIFSFIIYSCDEEESQTQSVPARDRAEQQATDLDTLQNYLNTHYFNSGYINNLSSYPRIEDIEIIELLEGDELPPNTTLLINAVEERYTSYEDTSYTYYVLNLENGQGDQPHFSDQVRVNYEGFLTNGTIFDESVTSTDIDLAFSIVGWNRVLSQFRTADSYSTNNDGTVSFDNYGIGVMFLPSGLSYFNSAAPGIPSYSCLIFKFELHQYKVMDHDNDYIPTYMEDIDGDFNILNDNTDSDQFSDFSDSDDDGDGYSTYREVYALELTDISLQGLENQIQELGSLSSNQFFTPIELEDDGLYSTKLITLEDTNENGIPNYLDPDDTGTLDN